MSVCSGSFSLYGSVRARQWVWLTVHHRFFFLPSTLPPFCNPSCLFPHTWILNWAANRFVVWTLASQESYIFWVFGVLLPSLYGSHVVSVFLTSNTSLTCSWQGKLKMWLTFHLAFQPEVLATKLTVITVGSAVANKHFWNISGLEKRPFQGKTVLQTCYMFCWCTYSKPLQTPSHRILHVQQHLSLFLFVNHFSKQTASGQAALCDWPGSSFLFAHLPDILRKCFSGRSLEPLTLVL